MKRTDDQTTQLEVHRDFNNPKSKKNQQAHWTYCKYSHQMRDRCAERVEGKLNQDRKEGVESEHMTNKNMLKVKQELKQPSY